MTDRRSLRFMIIGLVLILMMPSLPVQESSGGSVFKFTVSDFANGTRDHTITTVEGLKLDVEKEYLDNWTMLDDGHPGGKLHASLEYDEAQDEYVLFGFDWTWGWDMEVYTYNSTTDDWKDLKQLLKSWPPHFSNSCGLSLAYSIVYDGRRSEAIVFGGLDSDTWIFNLTEPSWNRKYPAISPTPRFSYDMAFDTLYDEVILFGGHEPTTTQSIPFEPAPHFNDTWTYNPLTNIWTNRTPVISPSGLCNHTMAYDQGNGVTILFGGRIEDAINETWAYNRSTNTWTNMSPGNAPSSRQLHSMVYDKANGCMIMFGGAAPGYNNETWTYNFSSNNWKNITQKYSPLPRNSHTMAYDSKNSQILIFGGWLNMSTGTTESQVADVWLLDSAGNWSVRSTKSPMPNWDYNMVFDDKNGEIILKSGYLFSGGPEMWRFNLSLNKWINLKTPGPFPYQNDNGMVYDRRHDQLLEQTMEYQGQSQTWIYNFSNTSWYPMDPQGPMPRMHRGAMAYNTREGKTILFGGFLGWGIVSNETWIYDFDNNTWKKMQPYVSPPARDTCTMAYVDSTSEIVMWGGEEPINGYLNDTWIYNYTTNIWKNVTKQPAPTSYYPYDYFGMLTYNTLCDEIVLALGRQTWKFNLSTEDWHLIHTDNTHASTTMHAIAYDINNDEILLFGGIGAYMWQGETWAFDHRVLYRQGNYTSQAIDIGGVPHYAKLDWSADVPEGTHLKFQFRSASSEANLSSRPFIGPDGTNNTYYNLSGQAISDEHQGKRWIQYRAYLNTSYDLLSPILKSVNITFNLLPDVPVLGYPANGAWTNSSRPIFDWASTDLDSAISGFEWQLDDSPLFDSVDRSSGKMVSTDLTYQPTGPIADGTWYWRVRTLDSDGDWGPFSGSRILRVDTGPPGPFEIVADPPGWTNGTIQLTFNTTDSAVGMGHYEVEIDGVSQGMVESPFELPALSDGDHEITVKAYDLLWNNISSQVTVFQDRTPPLTFAPTAEPPSWTNTSPRILFETTDAASGVDRYEVAIDGGAFSCQTSPFSLPGLPDGQHEVTVRAYDVASNYMDGHVMIYLDSTKPFNFSIASDIAGWTNQNPSLTFGALDNLSMIDHFEVKLPGGNFTNQTSPYNLPDLVDGRHNLILRAYDKASNYAEAVFEVLMDKTPPANFTPVANPDVWTNRSPTITFSTVDNMSGVSRYELGLAGGNMTARTSPFQFAGIPEGQLQVIVRAYDLACNTADATVIVHIDRTPPSGIYLKINDGEKTTSKRAMTLSILAEDPLSGLDSVCFSNDGIFYSGWEPFSSSKTWNLTSGSGSQTVYLKIRDKAGNEADPILAHIKYVPSAAASGSNLWPLMALLLIIIVVAAIGGLAWRASRKKKMEVTTPGAQEEEAEEAEAGEVQAVEAALEIPEAETPPTETEKEPEPPITTVLPETPPIPAKEVKAAAIPTMVAKDMAAPAKTTEAPAPRPAPVIARPVTPSAAVFTAPEGFAVEDIFLMYKDGRLIQHTTRRLKADMDVDIVTSMLNAVQEFIKESFGKAEGGELGSMEFGESKIMLQKGRHVALAAVITGPEAPGFRDEMRAAIGNIESEFGTVLPIWDGTVQKLAGAKRFLGQLGAYKPAEEVAGERAKVDVSLKSELEFYQGFIRLKVAVKNSMRTTITNTTFRLMFDEGALKLYSIEPEYEQMGFEVNLGNVGPREKKTVAFYLDPQICTESYVEGVLTYKDAEGNLEMIKMPKKLTSVVCPILFTDENINIAMLKRMAMEELDKKDTKVFAVPAMIGPQRAFEIGKAAIQHHDLRLVRELKNEKPYEAEAWYYGKAKGREEKVIVRARVIADKNFLEFFVASNSTLMLTGMLAELKSDLNKEIETRKVRMGMKQVTDQKEVDAMTTIRTLLEKATNAEIDAGDTEAR